MNESKAKTVTRWLMALLYIAAGVNHFRNPALYIRIIPDWLPAPELLNQLSGAAEIFLGVLLLIPRVSNLAAWGIVALLLAVFPANINMAFHPELTPTVPLWGIWLRLPLQGMLIWWSWLYTRSGGRDQLETNDARDNQAQE